MITTKKFVYATENGKSGTIEVSNDETVGHVKELISKDVDIPLEKLSLCSFYSDNEFENDKKVGDCKYTNCIVAADISDEKEDFVFLKNLQSKIFRLRIDLSKTFGELKIAYEKETDINRYMQVFVFMNKEMIDEEKPLKDYGITKGSLVFALLRLKGG
mmetsp:Transcript_39326/g.35018  ORF Transcript_39326/g.35018 Transcript_39326/m.35018 type:complete len:159 (-) Transcript_39326:198-674(-)